MIGFSKNFTTLRMIKNPQSTFLATWTTMKFVVDDDASLDPLKQVT